MLTLPSENRKPPQAIEDFRVQVAAALEGWDVNLIAYDDDVPEKVEFMSTALIATYGKVRVDISRHAGGHVVLVRLNGTEPVPFEDLATAKGEIDRAALLELACADSADNDAMVEPPVPFDRILLLLKQWSGDLEQDLDPTGQIAAHMQETADAVVARLLDDAHR